VNSFGPPQPASDASSKNVALHKKPFISDVSPCCVRVELDPKAGATQHNPAMPG
jgi:hypothetical protein